MRIFIIFFLSCLGAILVVEHSDRSLHPFFGMIIILSVGVLCGIWGEKGAQKYRKDHPDKYK
jgi:hypothetical protein